MVLALAGYPGRQTPYGLQMVAEPRHADVGVQIEETAAMGTRTGSGAIRRLQATPAEEVGALFTKVRVTGFRQANHATMRLLECRTVGHRRS